VRRRLNTYPEETPLVMVVELTPLVVVAVTVAVPFVEVSLVVIILPAEFVVVTTITSIPPAVGTRKELIPSSRASI
jgi:hypothetical protein